MAETTNKEVYQPMTFDAIKIGLASPEKILEWSRGEVTKPEKRRSSDENRLFLTVLFNLRVLITQR